jgi:hypothetical protein
MRRLKKKYMVQRGCDFCLDRIPPEYRGTYMVAQSRCPHDVCPYHELDEVEDYKDYLKSISDVPLGVLLGMARKSAEA